jgi:hypothetical protein
MDDTDSIWQHVKTWHIAQVLEYIPQQMKKFVGENKAARFELSGGQMEYIRLTQWVEYG